MSKIKDYSNVIKIKDDNGFVGVSLFNQPEILLLYEEVQYLHNKLGKMLKAKRQYRIGVDFETTAKSHSN